MSNTQVDSIINRLVAKTTDEGAMVMEDIALYTRDISRMLDDGWTDAEIVNLLKWTEAVQPDIEEDYACRRMAFVRERVAARMKQEGIVK